MRGSSAAGSGLTFLARGVLRSRSWRAPLTLRPGESHIAVPRRASRAGQGRQDSSAAGLARVWRPALVPPLVPRTSQWHAVPSHAPGCLAPEVARAGTEGWGNPGLRPRPCREPPAGGATPLSQGIPCRGHPFASPPRTFSEVLKTAPLSRDYESMKYSFSSLGRCLGRQGPALIGSTPSPRSVN